MSRSRQTRRGKKEKIIRSSRSRSNYANRCPRIYGISLFRKAFFPPVFKSRFLKILSSEIRRSNERIRRHDFEPITRFSFSARVNHYSEIYSLLFFYFYISEIYLVSSRLQVTSEQILFRRIDFIEIRKTSGIIGIVSIEKKTMVIEAKRLFYSSAYAQSWRSIRVDTVPCPITVVSGLLAAVLGPRYQPD